MPLTTSTRMTQIQRRISNKISSWTSVSPYCGKFGSRISGEPVQRLSKVFDNIARSKSYYLQQVHQPRHLSKSARLFGPDVLEVDITYFSFTYHSPTLPDPDCMPLVGYSHSVAPHHRLSFSSLHPPIRGGPTSLHGQPGIAHRLIDRGTGRRVRQDPTMLFHREPHLDLAGVYSTSILVPRR